MKTRSTIKFDPTTQRWKIYHMHGSEWLDSYATLPEAVNRVSDCIAQIWLDYHEYYIPELKRTRERESTFVRRH